MSTCEEAAARCTKVIKRRVLTKQARKARAQHLVNCCLALGKKEASWKPLTEFLCRRTFTEDREWQKELQRHCEEVHTDRGETRDAQEKRIEYFKKKGDQQFTVDGRDAEITVDLVLQARSKLSDNKVYGLEERVPETWNRLHMGGVSNISCQHLHVSVTNFLQMHWEWQEERSHMLKHGSNNVYGKLWTSREPSTRRGRGILRKLWKVTTCTDG